MGSDPSESKSQVASLRTEYESARARFQEQRETFKEFSNEGLNVFRLSILLVGVPAAVVGAINPQSLTRIVGSLYSTECAIDAFSVCLLDMTFVTDLAVRTFLLAILAHIMASGFEARGTHNETNPNDIHEVLAEEPVEAGFYRMKLRKYERRIENNDRIIFAMEFLLGAGKFLFVTAVAGAVVLAYALVFNRPFDGLWLGFAVGMLIMAGVVFPPAYIKADGGVPWRFTPHYPSLNERMDDHTDDGDSANESDTEPRRQTSSDESDSERSDNASSTSRVKSASSDTLTKSSE